MLEWVATVPPRQGWLAVLGVSGFVVRGTASLWNAVIEEGTQVERLLAKQWDAARSALPGTRAAPTSSRPSRPADA